MFEASSGNRVQEVINHHNSASLPRVKQRQKEKKGRVVGGGGDLKGSPTSMPRREEGGGDGRRKDQQSFLKSFSLEIISVISAARLPSCVSDLCFAWNM